MNIEAHLIPEGHSTINCFSGLESVKNELPSFDNKIECRAEIDRINSTMYIHMWFSGMFNLECSRCLKSYSLPISGDFRIIVKENSAKAGPVLDDDSVDFYYNDRNDLIDLSPAIYDEILVAIPLKPLCREDCEGISVSDNDIKIDFGQKRIENKQTDPRWDALRKLKEE